MKRLLITCSLFIALIINASTEINKPANYDELVEELVDITVSFYNDLTINEKQILLTRYEEILPQIYFYNIELYLSGLNFLSERNIEIGNYIKSQKFKSEELKIIKTTLGENNPDYAESLLGLSEIYYYLGNYDKAIKLASESRNFYKEEGLDSISYAASLHALALYNSIQGNCEEAIKIAEEERNILKAYNSLGLLQRESYAESLRGLALYYSNVGNFPKSILLATEMMSIYKEEYDNLNKDAILRDYYAVKYASSFSNSAIYEAGIGNYDKAIELEYTGIDILKEVFQEDNPIYMSYYASTLNNLATIYCNLNKCSESIILSEKALELKKQLFGEKDPSYIRTKSNISVYYYKLGELDKAIELEKEVLQNYKSLFGEKSIDYHGYMENLAAYHYKAGNFEEAIDLEYNVLKNREYTIGKKSPIYHQTLYNLWLLNYKHLKYEGAIKFIEEFFIENSSFIVESFTKLTSNERQYLWKKYRNTYYIISPYLGYKHNSKELLLMSYNNVLFSKGLLLNTDIEISKLLANGGDEEVISLFAELQATRRYINKLYEIPIEERPVDTDSLEKKCEALERELMQKSKVYGDFTRNLSIDWKQVQSALKDDDIAIEFVSFPTESDSIMYCALTLKKGYDSPRMIELFEAKQLSAIDPVDYYDTPEISNLVWRPLTEELSDVKNIFFAPAGEFYNIAIESLRDFDGEGYVFDRWTLYRLSSTRELALIKEDKNDTNVALYGGIKYDAEDFAFEQNPTEDYNNYYATTRSLPDSIGLRAGKGYLWHTLIEVEQIDSLYSHRSIPAQLYTGLVGSETSLKRLSGKKLSNLHISTHGFYWSESEVNSDEDLHHLKFLHQDDTPRLVEDKAMTRSGLLFAGANAVLQGEEIPEGCDDGILTAQEIAALDFRGLDLLVLSACQTGLGEIKGDGVFGLQRGFKKAGVQSIVMSLWEVPDEATQILMTEFYENYLSGKSKRESLLNAQKVVRETPGFEDPYYWAGFILLDGLN